jgi:hypothetical protein
LKAELAKGFITCIQGEKNLNDLLSIQRMNMGKEGISFVAESSKKKNKKKKHVAPPTPHVPFDICCTKEEWAELKGKKKVKVTGVSGAKVRNHRMCHLARSLRLPRPESSALPIITLAGNIILTVCFPGIIMGMSMINMLASLMVIDVLLACARKLVGGAVLMM